MDCFDGLLDLDYDTWMITGTYKFDNRATELSSTLALT